MRRSRRVRLARMRLPSTARAPSGACATRPREPGIGIACRIGLTARNARRFVSSLVKERHYGVSVLSTMNVHVSYRVARRTRPRDAARSGGGHTSVSGSVLFVHVQLLAMDSDKRIARPILVPSPFG